MRAAVFRKLFGEGQLVILGGFGLLLFTGLGSKLRRHRFGIAPILFGFDLSRVFLRFVVGCPRGVIGGVLSSGVSFPLPESQYFVDAVGVVDIQRLVIVLRRRHQIALQLKVAAEDFVRRAL